MKPARVALLACVLTLAWALKRHYAAADVGDLGWVLTPVTRLTTLVTGMSFEWESGAGYLARDEMFLIAKPCAGVNFMIAAFVMTGILLSSMATSWKSAAAFALTYIGSWDALYGTAYGVMVSAKLVLFAALLLLGLGNFLVVERLRRDPAAPLLRMRRFAEAEIGIGVTLFFAAASLTSVPPSVDLVQDRVTLSEIAARNAPRPLRLASPDRDTLALPALQSRLDREAEQTRAASASAFTPGAGALPPRNAADVAWSEYNHHWAGLFVGLIGCLALLHRAGVGWARHWPLVFLGLAAFLFVRADPEAWPLGRVGFFESLRDVEVLQHRVFVVLIAAFAFFEWGVRTGRLRRPGAALVFPVATAVGAGLLLTHSHAIGNVKEQLLIELSHTPLALAGVGAGWARWLEVRLHGRGRVARAMGWVWPVCFLVVGAVLLLYREA